MTKEDIEKTRLQAIEATLRILRKDLEPNIGDFEKAVANAEEKRVELDLAMNKLRIAIDTLTIEVINPGDAIAGIGLRIAMKSFAPSLLKQMDKIGIAPGRRS